MGINPVLVTYWSNAILSKWPKYATGEKILTSTNIRAYCLASYTSTDTQLKINGVNTCTTFANGNNSCDPTLNCPGGTTGNYATKYGGAGTQANAFWAAVNNGGIHPNCPTRTSRTNAVMYAQAALTARTIWDPKKLTKAQYCAAKVPTVNPRTVIGQTGCDGAAWSTNDISKDYCGGVLPGDLMPWYETCCDYSSTPATSSAAATKTCSPKTNLTSSSTTSS